MKNTSVSLCIFASGLIILFVLPLTMASDETKNYMVYMKQKPDGVTYEEYQRNALAKALGSDAAAKEAIVYHYSDVVSGFSAKLTPEQAEALKKVPEVTSVTYIRPYTLFDPSLQV